VLDQRGQLLRAALGFAGLPRPSYDRSLWALRTWLDSWSGIGRVVVGMARQGYDLQLTRYDETRPACLCSNCDSDTFVAPAGHSPRGRFTDGGVSMLVMITAKYPASSVKRAIEVYMSPETPKRPDSGRELCSFVHGDHSGYANYLVFDVEDRQLGEFLRGYAQRTIHMETRIPGLTVQTVVGQTIPDAINTAMQQLPR
jgi:hypothetical protein